jgi:V8-like Glu-specific endopeptidase
MVKGSRNQARGDFARWIGSSILGMVLLSMVGKGFPQHALGQEKLPADRIDGSLAAPDAKQQYDQGPADRKQAMESLLHATMKIQQGNTVATCFLVDDGKPQTPVLITAAHVVESMQGPEAQLVARRMVSPGTYEKLLVPISVGTNESRRWRRHPTEDVAALRIDLPEGSTQLATIDHQALIHQAEWDESNLAAGVTVHFLGYPHRDEASPSGFPILRHGSIACFPLQPFAAVRQMLVGGEVYEGDSGGPVFLQRPSEVDERWGSGPKVVGIVAGQRMIDEEVRMLQGVMKLRHRFALANVIMSPAIVATIESLDDVGVQPIEGAK